MPIYEYRCSECHAEFEVWQKISDKPVHKCAKCGSRKVSKLISQTSFQLKGTGWYVTDYAKKGGGTGASSTSSKEKEKVGDAKTESKSSACGASEGGCGAGACGPKKDGK
ncbi:MAG: zinc ribbon domain-containing protein [Deltaproteobacteria bacterium]|nr:zinc ribbon domain-containing protein [Deltaproteobacteria bacterium]